MYTDSGIEMTTSLNTLLTDLLHDPAARLSLQSDPAGFFDSHGWSDLDADELDEALSQLVDSLPVSDAVALDEARLDLPPGQSNLGLDAMLSSVLDSYDTAIELQPDGFDDVDARLFEDESGESGAVPDGLDDADLKPSDTSSEVDSSLDDSVRTDLDERAELDEVDLGLRNDDTAFGLDEAVTYGTEDFGSSHGESPEATGHEEAGGTGFGETEATPHLAHDHLPFETAPFETGPFETGPFETGHGADSVEFDQHGGFAHPDQANADDPFDLLD